MRFSKILFGTLLFVYASYADNQTSDLSAVLSGDLLPFTLSIEQSSFTLPNGLQTFAFATSGNKVLALAGRTNGLHGFDPGDNNFPPQLQNTTVFVIDFNEQAVYQRSLLDPLSGLNSFQIDALSVTAPGYRQFNDTLYVLGGYGVDTSSGQFTTKSLLTAINVQDAIEWVQNPSSSKLLSSSLLQVEDPVFQVTGGVLEITDAHSPFLLVFGQDFEGFYTTGSTGIYTEQVRAFKLVNDKNSLRVFAKDYKPQSDSYRRRDLNVVPRVKKKGKSYDFSYIALSGVFTETGGVWTVPVFIKADGSSYMPDPFNPSTFKQGMNNYNSAYLGLFSNASNQQYEVLLGGLGYETYDDGEFSTDSEIPFTNNVTILQIDSTDQITPYVSSSQYPVILSEFVNPGNPFLFGAGAVFVPASGVSIFPNKVISLDLLPKGRKVLLGHIIGGIASTLTNTNTRADSEASPYIFDVFLERY